MLALAGSAALQQGCVTVDDTLGANLVPENQQMRAGVCTIPDAADLNPRQYVETRLYQTDSIVSSNISYGYFGQERYDTLGRRVAGFLSQMVNYYPVPEGYFGKNPIFDSALLLLKVKKIGRDTLTTQHFVVYEIRSNDYITKKEKKEDSTFYFSFDPVEQRVIERGQTPLFRFELGGQEEGKGPSKTYVTLKPTDEGRKYIRHLMLQKSGPGDEFRYENDYSIYSVDSVEQWIEEFRGLYIAPDPERSVGKGEGALFGTELETSGLAVYGRTREERDPSLIKDTIGMVYYFVEKKKNNGRGNLSVNVVRRDYSDASNTRIDIAGAVETNPDRPLNTRIHVEGLGGVVSEITFTKEFFDELQARIDAENRRDNKNFRTFAFSRVAMSLYFNEAGYDWTEIGGNPGNTLRLVEQMNASPKRLGLYTDFKKRIPVEDYNYEYELKYDTELAYFGKVNRSRGCYVMDITAYIQKIWNNYVKERDAAVAEARPFDIGRVKDRTVYVAPEAVDLYTFAFGTVQGMPASGDPGGSAVGPRNNAPVQFEFAYNMIN